LGGRFGKGGTLMGRGRKSEKSQNRKKGINVEVSGGSERDTEGNIHRRYGRNNTDIEEGRGKLRRIAIPSSQWEKKYWKERRERVSKGELGKKEKCAKKKKGVLPRRSKTKKKCKPEQHSLFGSGKKKIQFGKTRRKKGLLCKRGLKEKRGGPRVRKDTKKNEKKRGKKLQRNHEEKGNPRKEARGV